MTFPQGIQSLRLKLHGNHGQIYFFFPLTNTESRYFTFFQPLKPFLQGLCLVFAVAYLNKAVPFEQRCRRTFSSALQRGKHLALALPCHPLLQLQEGNTNTRGLGVPGEAKQHSLL